MKWPKFRFPDLLLSFSSTIPSRIHFRGLEGPDMTIIILKHAFQLKSNFRGGRPLCAYPGLITGQALGRAQGLALGRAERLALVEAVGLAWPGQAFY